jgi:hypothetical protein
MLFASSQAMAEPSKPISAFMEAPASAFDVFILQLFEQSKCYRGWFGNTAAEKESDLCMTMIDYNFNDNLIIMNFSVRDSHEKMKGFSKGSATPRP